MRKLFTLLTLLLGVCSGTWAQSAITITWPMVDNNNATSQAGSANVASVVTVNNATLSTAYTSLAWADSKQLSYSDGAAGDNGNNKFYAGGVAVTNNPNDDSNNASVNENCYLKFTFTVAGDKTFTPTGFSFDCGRSGTDAGCVQGALILADGSTKSTSTVVRPTRSDKKNVYDSKVSKTISGANAYEAGSTVTFYIYIGGKCGGKTLYFKDVTITGTYVSSNMTQLSVPSITVNQATGQVTIGSVEHASKVTYTTDGTDPTSESTTYGAPFTVNENCTIKAIAIGDGETYANSSIASQEAAITVEDPVITSHNGTVGITCATDGATIKYSTDNENWTTYSIPFTIFTNQTIYAKAEKASFKNNSGTVNSAITAAPAAASGSQSITLYYDTETNFSLNTDGNSDVLTGKSGTDYDGFTITLDNEGQTGGNIKALSYGSSIDEKTSLKGSNGRKITIAIPSNLRANRITLKSYNNGAISSDSYWSNVGGTAYTTANEIGLQSISDAAHPDVRVFALNDLTSIDIVNNGAQQQCFIATIDYTTYVSEPADGEYNIAATWDFSTSAAQSASGAIGTSGSYSLKATNEKSIITYVGGSSDTYDSSNGYLKHGGASSDTRYFILPITSNGTLGVTTKTNNGTFTIKKAANTTTTWKDATAFDPAVTITTTADGTEVTGVITYDANNPYLIIGFSNKLYTQKITWTPSVESVTLTTSANMAGWRAFYDASNGYTLDANTTAYVATANNAGSVTLTPLAGGVPSGTPVILKTTSSAESHKMTLTKANVAAYEGTNLLTWETSEVLKKYRLGYGAEGVGFYPYSGTPASGAVILNVANPNPTAKALTFVFIDPTGISSVSAKKAVSTGKRYNLSGQLVGEDYKGIVIENGKKFNQ